MNLASKLHNIVLELRALSDAIKMATNPKVKAHYQQEYNDMLDVHNFIVARMGQ